MLKVAWGRGITTGVLSSVAFVLVSCLMGGCSAPSHAETHSRTAAKSHPLSIAVAACRREVVSLGQRVDPTASLASGSAGAEAIMVPSTLTGGPTMQSGTFAVYQAFASAQGMSLLPLLGRRAFLVTIPAADAGSSLYCLVADGKAYAAWKTAATIESLDGRTLSQIVGNVWTWATRNHYYVPAPASSGAGPEGVILSLAWAVNEGKPIAPYFAPADVSDGPFATLQHWIPMGIQLLPQWSTPTMKEYEVASWQYPAPNPTYSGPPGFFQVAETSPGVWQIVGLGTGP